MRKLLARLLFKTIGELPPGQRLNVLQPVYAVFALAGVVYFLYNVTKKDNSDRIADLKEQMANQKTDYREGHRADSTKIEKQAVEIDSLKRVLYSTVLEMYENRLETVNQKKKLLKIERKILGK